MPMPWPSRARGKAAVTRAALLVSSIAAPAACRTRRPTTVQALGARPQRKLANVKVARPSRYICRRPNMSASRPKKIIRTVLASMKASSIQLAAVALASKWRTTVGSATLSALPDMPEKMLARLTTERVRQASLMTARSSGASRAPASSGAVGGGVATSLLVLRAFAAMHPLGGRSVAFRRPGRLTPTILEQDSRASRQKEAA